ncbi:MAG: hypothetical protein ACLQU3_10355 [Limisphaerales bacterium]
MTKRILLADDDASVREALGQVLELEHYDVVLTGGGAAGAKPSRSCGRTYRTWCCLILTCRTRMAGRHST